MKNAARILIAAALVAGLAGSRQVAAAGGSAEAFAQLKTLVGHWEEQKGSEYKSTLDIELTAGGTTLLENSAWWSKASRWRWSPCITSMAARSN